MQKSREEKEYLSKEITVSPLMQLATSENEANLPFYR